jgi:hypothetical protein
MNDAPTQNGQPQQEVPQYEKPSVTKIGNMSANTKAKSGFIPG